MITIEMLPAAHGDCLWIEYGSCDEIHRILIDGGPAHTYPALRERILQLPADQRHFELLVVTHIDCDHIDGIVRLLQDAEVLNCCFERIWFNGREQLNEVPDVAGEELGAQQGEYLSLLIADYEARSGEQVWNKGFDVPYIALGKPGDALPVIDDLPGGISLTLLSPTQERLLALKDHWDSELDKSNLLSGDETQLRRRLAESRSLRPLGDVLGDEETADEIPELPAENGSDTELALDDELGGDKTFGSDNSIANGSSIALLLEYDGDRFLLAGDAWPSVLQSAIDQLVSADQRLDLTVFKLPHHGSVANVNEDLLDHLACKHYMVSTSGAVFRHPHEKAIELLLTHHHGRGKPRLHFNYRTITTARWEDADDQKQRGYYAFYPKGLSLRT